jgi:hypothetical protein
MELVTPMLIGKAPMRNSRPKARTVMPRTVPAGGGRALKRNLPGPN